MTKTKRILATALLLLALAPGAALAQQMPDPRQMSGTPRPDQQVKLGTVTVRLVHGELSKVAAAGTPVHMIALRADGSAERITQPLDEQGRATFDGLAQDGSIAYYAYALLGDDRLESQIITLDKMAGVRLMLVGRKLDQQGQPIGNPVDEAVSEEDPMKQPAGEVWVAVAGRGISKDTPVELIEIPAKGSPTSPPQVVHAVDGGNQQFVARFADVAGGDGKVYLARLKVGSRYYNSKPFMMRAGSGVGRRILVIDQVVVSIHLAAEVEDASLRVQTQYTLQNFQGGPYDPGPDGLELPLPVGAVGGSLSDETGKVKLDPGKRIIWKGVLPPGQSEVIAAYGMPINDGVVNFEMAAPLGLFQSTLVISQSPGSASTAITVQVPAGAREVGPIPMPVMEGEKGRKFHVASNIQVPGGSVLRFTVSGLPQVPRMQKVWQVGAGIVVLLLVALALLLTIFDPFNRRAGAGKSAGVAATGEGGARASLARRKELTTRREQLYDELVTLERKRAAQQIDDDRYETNRQAVVSRLTLVLRELDQLDAAGSTRAS